MRLVPNEEEFPRMCGQEDHAMKEAWEGQGQAEHICDLARRVQIVDSKASLYFVTIWKTYISYNFGE